MAPAEKSLPAIGLIPRRRKGNRCNHTTQTSQFALLRRRIAFFIIVLTATVLLYSSFVTLPESLSLVDSLAIEKTALNWPWTKKNVCQPPSPNLFAYHPPRPSNDLIEKASKELDEYLTKRVSEPEIDSIALSIVTPAGPLFLGGYGSLRANDSDLEAPAQVVDENSIYRIASISKMFTVVETLILREKGLLNWDDPVDKFVANISLPSESYGWAGYLDGLKSNKDESRVTLRQLSSHMGGIGRDYPPIDVGEWPVPVEDFPSFASQFDSLSSRNQILDAVSRYPLVNAPYKYPIYSNTGFSLLGLANIGAAQSELPAGQEITHRELIDRDIFKPLRMTSSFFRVPESEELRAHIAVPSKDPQWADISLGEVDDPAGGQYSSLKDLSTLMKTLLSPTAAGGVLPAPVVREWLRPIHVWGAGSEQIGAPWEGTTLSGAAAYGKGGNLPGYHSEFVIVPEHSFGIVLLVTGSNADTTTLLKETGKRFVPVFAKLHEAELRRRYNGKWTAGDDDVAEVAVRNGALYLNKLRVGGRDVLELAEHVLSAGGRGAHVVHSGRAVMQPKAKAGSPVVLWPTGRIGEFRLAFGRPGLNKLPEIGCLPYWISLDWSARSREAPLDLVYWQRGKLVYPSAGVTFSRS